MAKKPAPTTKALAPASAWLGTKGYLGLNAVTDMMSKGYTKDQLSKLATTQSKIQFGPGALQHLGVSTVYNYDPAKYNTAFSPSTVGKTKTQSSYSGKNLYTTKSTPYTLAGLKTSDAAPTAPTKDIYTPSPLAIGGGSSEPQFTMPEINFPAAPPQQFAAGGMSAGVDGGASGFRRKKSSARKAGLTSKGTGQFKITGQSSKSSGLNIGV